MSGTKQTTHKIGSPHGHGGSGRRSGDGIPRGLFFRPGMFGRMFPGLTPLSANAEDLTRLGLAMVEPGGVANQPNGGDSGIPSGFTYLGQFIDHDITFDTTPLPERTVDPLAVRNFRTPKLDLDSVYGLGPVDQPYLYERGLDGAERTRFVIGRTAPSQDQDQRPIADLPNDLPRSARGDALIGDPRNDENLIVAQLHLAFLKFHNKVADRYPTLTFPELRRIVTWHYQWIVLNDFLPRILHRDELKRVVAEGPTHFRFAGEPFMPVEFSAAAYRLHTMIRGTYDFNRVFGPGDGRLAPATLELLFRFTGVSGSGGSVPVPSIWIIDWQRFFDFGTRPPNFARRMDAQLTPALTELGLAAKNLRRGQSFALPSGQDIARALGLGDRVLPPEVIAAAGEDGKTAAALGFHRQSPLWYYLMKEAELIGEGERLGPVGSRIVAEVIVGLLRGDPESFLAAHPSFVPDLPARTPGTFLMTDLLTFVGELDPLGNPA